jgi:hypothetical protein
MDRRLDFSQNSLRILAWGQISKHAYIAANSNGCRKTSFLEGAEQILSRIETSLLYSKYQVPGMR